MDQASIEYTVPSYRVPRDEAQIQQFLNDREPEGSYLEYKSSRLFQSDKEKVFNSLSKDVSAFANSGGGIIIIGIEEEDGKTRRPSMFLPVSDTTKNAQWLEDGLLPRIRPAVPGLEIFEVNYRQGGFFVIIHVPMSFRGPHQNEDKKFYARRQFRCEPMEAFEIEDIRQRRGRDPSSGLFAQIEFDQRFFVCLAIENLGDLPLSEISITFDPSVKDKLKLNAPFFEKGLTCLHAKQKMRYSIGTIREILSEPALLVPSVAKIAYSDARGVRKDERLTLDFSGYDRSIPIISDGERIERVIRENLSKISKSIDELNNSIKSALAPIANATGVAISHQSLEHLNNVLSGRADESKWPAEELDWKGFREVLGVDANTASSIYHYFQWRDHLPNKKLEEQEWLTPDLLNLIKKKLIISDDC